MNKLLFCVLLFLHLAVISSAQGAEQDASAPASATSINVKNYGAKGDGIADDTKAIQAAANAGYDLVQKWPVRVRHWNSLAKGISDNPHPEIVFPSGTYKISSTIVFQRSTSLRGLGTAVIEQSSADHDSFYFHSSLRVTVENLHFNGGKTQLRFYTANLGTARITVQHCTFSQSKSYAVECRSYTKERLTGADWNRSKPWPPYTVTWQKGTPQLTANNAENLTQWYNSTAINIAHCCFENVMHAADLSGDTLTIRDCEVTTNRQMDGAAFNLAGKIHLYRIKGLARLDKNKHQYWIRTSSIFSVRDSLFDTDSLQGICLVRSYQRPASSAVIIENTRVKSAGSPEGAVTWIAKDTQPNIISINGITEISGQPVKAVIWEETPDEQSLEKIKEQPATARSDYIYKLQITGNSPNIDNNTPPAFKTLMLSATPRAAMESTFIPRLSWDFNTLEKGALASGQVIQATDYGVDQDPKTDDTAAIEKVFRAVAGQKNALVIFPAGAFTLSRTIELPPDVVVRGAGVAAFIMKDVQRDIFSTRNAETVAFKNCDFNGGRNALNLHSAVITKTRIAFDNCSFYDQAENGVYAVAGDGKVGEPNQTELWHQGGIFATMRAITTNASHSQLAIFWAMTAPRLDNDAFIRNLGGKMRIEAMLGNPVLWQGKRSKIPDSIQDWQFSKNTRWIDNWGQIYSLDNRFGGESGGICNIYNRSKNGTVYVGGGVTRFYNGVTRQSLLYLEETPRVAVLSSITGRPLQVEDGAWVVQQANGSDGKDLPQITVRSVPTP